MRIQGETGYLPSKLRDTMRLSGKVEYMRTINE